MIAKKAAFLGAFRPAADERMSVKSELSKVRRRLFTIFIVVPLATFAQPVPSSVGIAGIVLDEPLKSLPRSLGLKCTLSLSSFDAPSSKDPVIRSLQAQLQRLKARGNYTCYSTRPAVVGQLKTQSVSVYSDYGRITGIRISFLPDSEAGAYNANARIYLANLIEKRYGPGIASSSRIREQRWSLVKLEHRWKLPSAKIELVDAPSAPLELSFDSTWRFQPDAATLAVIAAVDAKIAAREAEIGEKKMKAASRAERDLFPSK